MKNLEHHRRGRCSGALPRPSRSLEKLSNEEVNVRVIHCAVGAHQRATSCWPPPPTPSSWALSMSAPTLRPLLIAERDKVDMRMYRVIYECIEEIESAMKGMLDPKVQRRLSWAASRCASGLQDHRRGIGSGS